MKLFNKRGSFTVFLVMAFSAALIMVYGAFAAAGFLAVGSVTDAFGRLWGNSILGEYDLNLKDRYGIFAFYGDENMVEEKLDFYAEETFSEKKYISYGGAICSLEEYPLLDLDNFSNQIELAVLFDSIPLGNQEAEESGTYGNRYIRNAWILKSLPSASAAESFSVENIVEQIKTGKGIENLIGNSKTNTYIFTYFKDCQNERELGKTYFKNEIEYIISGKADDERAWKNVKNKLLLMRNLLNLYYLYTCPEKKEAAMALAAVLTPGPEAAITQGLLLEGWALAEANNDLKMLQANETVPLLKKDDNWAITLENFFSDETEKNETEENKKEEEKYIKPAQIEGNTYEEYLRILINFLPEKIKLLRIMDLIQINMKYLYCDYFLIKDYYTGLNFSMKVNGVDHEFEEFY